MNIITIIGRLARDPEVKLSSNEHKYTTFTVASNRRDKERNADFLPCIAWGKKAELVEQYLKKGSRVCIVGALESRAYEKDGERRTSYMINVSDMEFLDTKKEKEEAASTGSGYELPPEPPKVRESLELNPEDYIAEDTEGLLPFSIND